MLWNEVDVGNPWAEDGMPSPPFTFLKDEHAEAWEKGWKNQTGDMASYGRAVYVFAARWARRMENAIGDPENSESSVSDILQDVREELQEATDNSRDMGITGFQGAHVIVLLANWWIHGETLRRLHNKEYGQPDTDGIVNPAVLRIGIKRSDG